MKIFLDDERKPPEGWYLVSTPQEAIEWLQTEVWRKLVWITIWVTVRIMDTRSYCGSRKRWP